MYALINKCGKDSNVVAVSKDKELLRKKLVTLVKEYIKSYFIETDDEFSQNLGKEYLKRLEGFKGDYWDDEDDSYLMSYEIVPVRELVKKTKPATVKMAFGSELVRKLENIETSKEAKALFEEYDGTDNLIVRTFKTRAERDAYLMGVRDNYGWEMYEDIWKMYPQWAKLIES